MMLLDLGYRTRHFFLSCGEPLQWHDPVAGCFLLAGWCSNTVKVIHWLSETPRWGLIFVEFLEHSKDVSLMLQLVKQIKHLNRTSLEKELEIESLESFESTWKLADVACAKCPTCLLLAMGVLGPDSHLNCLSDRISGHLWSRILTSQKIRI
ncbi:hypothetical protein C0J52_17209 [Blattella germanica]|nr:hypothetical protein C0J52_17209 [Blattella germanica]